jgi:hypothetical protein
VLFGNGVQASMITRDVCFGHLAHFNAHGTWMRPNVRRVVGIPAQGTTSDGSAPPAGLPASARRSQTAVVPIRGSTDRRTDALRLGPVMGGETTARVRTSRRLTRTFAGCRAGKP